jgi:hypothetical protein
MHQKVNPIMRIISIITVLCFLASCMTPMPERFATVNEVYPSGKSLDMPPDDQQDSIKKSTYDAPYEDVFRAVTVAATQAQFHIESTDKATGSILATRVISGIKGQIRHFYHIMVIEKGPKTTEVIVLNKVQSACEKASAGRWVSLVLMIPLTIGLVLLGYPEEIIRDSRCSEESSVKWATRKFSSQDSMSNLFVFTMNNLIAAGAI